MIQFHAIQLLYIIKSHDRLGFSKLVHQCISRKSFNNPLVLVCLIRFTWKLMCDDVLEGRTIPGSNPAGSQRQVGSCIELLEALVKDSNRCIGTFYITTLLRIANVKDIDLILLILSTILLLRMGILERDDYKLGIILDLKLDYFK